MILCAPQLRANDKANIESQSVDRLIPLRSPIVIEFWILNLFEQQSINTHGQRKIAYSSVKSVLNCYLLFRIYEQCVFFLIYLFMFMFIKIINLYFRCDSTVQNGTDRNKEKQQKIKSTMITILRKKDWVKEKTTILLLLFWFQW